MHILVDSISRDGPDLHIIYAIHYRQPKTTREGKIFNFYHMPQILLVPLLDTRNQWVPTRMYRGSFRGGRGAKVSQNIHVHVGG